jgi:glycosyltransferase involved in cell wall biosynthesis
VAWSEPQGAVVAERTDAMAASAAVELPAGRGTVPVADRVDSAAYARLAHPAVSVVVSTRGRARFLPGLLQALQAQQPVEGGFEVVVVDDASEDDTWPQLQQLAAGTSLALRAVRLAGHVGQGPGRTLGVLAARGEVVAFTDDDCLPSAAWLDRLTAPLRADGPPALVCQGRTEAWPGDAGAAGAWARTIWVLRPTWLFETCNVAYRRQDVLAAGVQRIEET